MNPLAALKIAWIAVYTVLGVNLALLMVFRRAGRDRARFGGLLALCAVYDVASLAQYHAFPAALPWAESLRVATGITVLASLVEISVALADLADAPRWRLVVRLSRCVVAAGVLGAATGMVFTGGHYSRSVWCFGQPLTYVETELSAFGAAVLSLTALPMAAAFVGFYRAARAYGGWAWTVFGAFTLLAMTTAVDAFAALRHLPVPYLTEHATFLFVTAVSYAFIARASEDLFRREAELYSVQRSLESVRATLAEREPLAALGELSTIVAHEIRQPLTIIKNAVASLRRPELAAADRAQLYDILDEECDRANRVVTDLLTLARPLQPRRVMVPLRELVVRSLGPAHRANAMVDLRSDPAAEVPVACDAHLMRHALENVIENAAQAMGPNGNLTVLLTRGARGGVDGNEITIIDSGEGMNTEVRSKARKAFFTTRANGTGLGLAIVDRILVAHDGAVEIESRRGEGTTVRLFLPDGRLSDAPEALAARAGGEVG